MIIPGDDKQPLGVARVEDRPQGPLMPEDWSAELPKQKPLQWEPPAASVFMRNAEKNPEEAAEITGLSQKLGMRPELVERQLPLARILAKKPDWEKFAKDYPALTEMAASDWFMRHAHDDLDALAKVEAEATRRANLSMAEGAFEAVMRPYIAGVLQTEQNELAERRFVQGDTSPEIANRIARIDEDLKSLNFKPVGFTESPLRFVTEQTINTIPFMTEIALGAARTGAKTATATGLGAAALSAVAPPAEVLAVPAAATAGFVMGAPLGGLDTSRRLQAGEMALRLSRVVDDKGNRLTPETIALVSQVVGAVNAGVETVAFGQLLKTVPGLNGLTGKAIEQSIGRTVADSTVNASLGEIAKRWAYGAAAEGGEEAFQQATQVIGEAMAKGASNVSRGTAFEQVPVGQALSEVAEAGMTGLVVGAALASPGTAASVLTEKQKAREAKQFLDQQGKFNDALNSTVLKERSPLMAEAFARKTFGDKDVVQLSGAAIFDNREALAPALEKLGIDTALVDRAKAEGADLNVSLAAVHARLTPEEAKAILPHVRANENMPTSAEVEGLKAAGQSAADFELYQARLEEDVDFYEEMRRVHSEQFDARYQSYIAQGKDHVTAEREATREAESASLALSSFVNNPELFATHEARMEAARNYRIQFSDGMSEFLPNPGELDFSKQTGQLITDEMGQVVGRMKSTNPAWFKDNQYKPGTVREAEAIINKFKAGKKLTENQQLFLDEAIRINRETAEKMGLAQGYQSGYEKALAAKGLTAAIRDPMTGKVYTGRNHRAVIDAAPKNDNVDVLNERGFIDLGKSTLSTSTRLFSEWDGETDNVGFTSRNGEFMSRRDVEAVFGASTVEDLRELYQPGEADADLMARVESEREEVVQRYKDTSLWMKAPNGQPTKLTEAQWVAVRTPAFKAWFGDWEAVGSQKFLDGTPIAKMQGDEVPKFQKLTELARWVAEDWKARKGGTVNHPMLGAVALSLSGAKDSIGHGMNSVKGQAFYLVPDIIENGKFLGQVERTHPEGPDAFLIGAPISIGGQAYIAYVEVREQQRGGHNFYVHEVVLRNTKPQPEFYSVAAATSGAPLHSSKVGAIRKIAQSIRAVNPDTASKVVDENGEPLVVYHETAKENQQGIEAEGFDINRVGARGSDEGVPDGVFLKTSDKGIMGFRGDEAVQLPFFASLKNPLVVPSRWELQKHLRADGRYEDLELAFLEADREGAREIDAADDDSLPFDKWKEQTDAAMAKVKNGVRAAAGKARERATEILKGQGYDGLIIQEDEGSFGRKTDALVVFDGTQVKGIGNRGTYSMTDKRPLLQPAPTGPRGSYNPATSITTLFRTANKSTIHHEMAHFFFTEIERLIDSGAASEKVIADYAKVQGWYRENAATLLADANKLEKEAAARENREAVEVTAEDVEDAIVKGSKARVRSAWVALHEYFAEGYETYLAEGKAPNAELAGAFERFKQFMVAVYRSVASMRVQITDEMRGVYGRLLATQDEIDLFSADLGVVDLTQKEVETLGLSDADAKLLNTLTAETKTSAARLLQARRDAGMRELKREWMESAKVIAGAERVHALRDALAVAGEGLDLQELTENFGEDAAKEINAKRVGVKLAEIDGQPLGVMAAAFGYDSIAEMVDELRDAPTKTERTRQLYEELVAQHDGREVPTEALIDNVSLETLLREYGRKIAEQTGAAKGIRAEERMKAADQELAARMDQGKQTTKELQAEAARRVAEYDRLNNSDALRAWATFRLADMPMSEAANPKQFVAAFRRANREMHRAIARGDWLLASEKNEQAVLNYHLANASLEAKRLMDKTDRVARLLKSKTVQPQTKEVLAYLNAKFALSGGKAAMAWQKFVEDHAKAGKPLPSVSEWFKAAAGDGEIDIDGLMDEGEAGRIVNQIGPTDLKALTYDQFTAIMNVVDQVALVDLNERRIISEKKRIDKEAAKKLLNADRSQIKVERLGQFTGWMKKKTKGTARAIHAAHLKTEAMMLAMGDGKITSWHRMIYQPIAAAADAEAVRAKAELKEMRRLLSVYSKAELATMAVRRIYVKELGRSASKEQLLSMALNLGNPDNMAKLIDGLQHEFPGVTLEAVMAAVNKHLDSRDADFVQMVWDHVESFREERFALEERTTGMRPPRIMPEAVQIGGKQLRGGYYHIAYDRSQSSKTAERGFKQDAEALFGGKLFNSPKTQQGALKTRTKTSGGQVIRLDLGVWTGQVVEAIHDITHREAILSVNRLLRDEEVAGWLVDRLGLEAYNQLRPWLVDVSNYSSAPPVGFEKFYRWGRVGTSIVKMGLKVGTVLQQLGGFTTMGQELGPKFFAMGMAKAYGRELLSLPTLIAETRAKSAFMDDRINNSDREMADATKGFDPLSMTQSATEKVAFAPIAYAQFAVDLPTWWGAYYRGLEMNGGNEARAIQEADMTVRKVHGSGRMADLARVQRGSELAKLFTMFYSYMNTAYNAGYLAFSGITRENAPKRIWQASGFVLAWYFVAPAVAELLSGRGPDEDEEWWYWMLKLGAAFPAQTIVGLRDVAGAVSSHFPYRITPAETAYTTVLNSGRKIVKAAKEKKLAEAAKPAADAAGYLLHLPLEQVVITVGNMRDVQTGKAPFRLRDVFYRKPPKEKQRRR